MARDRNVRFIRKNGRVIPIRTDGKRKRVKQGLGAIAGASAFSIGGGYLSGRVQRSSNLFAAKSLTLRSNMRAAVSRQLDLFEGGLRTRSVRASIPPNLAGAMHRSLKLSQKKARYAKASDIIFRKTSLLTSAVVGFGVERALDASGFDQTDIGSQIGTEFVGFAAAAGNQALANRFYQKGLSGASVTKGLSQDASKGFKALGSLAKKVIRRKVGF